MAANLVEGNTIQDSLGEAEPIIAMAADPRGGNTVQAKRSAVPVQSLYQHLEEMRQRDNLLKSSHTIYRNDAI